MTELSGNLTSTGLWQILKTRPDLEFALCQLRATSELIAAKVAETIPEFTDHSVIHMDALWEVADTVFTPSEREGFSVAEVFVLGCSFYVHDLGMALGITKEGRAQIESSDSYRSSYERAVQVQGIDEQQAKARALREGARALHAEVANILLDVPFPGIDRYLFESSEIRERWGSLVGKVAASHHWSLREVDARLGTGGRLPAPSGGTLDLGLIACALRIIDYAHINAGRAPRLDRVLRSGMSEESLVHWHAQERISGPIREADLLVFATMRPIADLDAWWTFYEMAVGLDKEITAVDDYLSERAISAGRFSLEGVKGVKSPTAFAKLVHPGGFAPVDVRFRPDSMTRLVHLLGGKQLYGQDQFAAIRELMQNASDAIHLRQARERSHGFAAAPGRIDLKYDVSDGRATLSVSDDGVGMSSRIVTTYLLGIAADYWRSSDFYGEFPEAEKHGFHPVGRFGIGFLSVFMFGEDVEVETQQLTGENLSLRLKGVGRRGALEVRPPALKTGTTVRIDVAPEKQGNLEGLARIVQAKGPMLDITVRVTEKDVPLTIEPGWWKAVSQDELVQFVYQRDAIATTPLGDLSGVRRRNSEARLRSAESRLGGYRALVDIPRLNKWPGVQPELMADDARIVASPNIGAVVLCTKGFAIATITLAGMCGVVEIGEVELNAARSLPLGFDSDELRSRILLAMWDSIIEATDRLLAEGNITSRFKFLRRVASVYGLNALADTATPWISVLERPGNVILRTVAELRQRIANMHELFVTYNINPWQAEEWIRFQFPDAPTEATILPVSVADGPPIRHKYGTEEGPVDGPLPCHFVDPFSGSEASRLDEAHLLLATIESVAEAWGVRAEDLQKQQWRRQKESLVGRLRRE